VVVIAVQSLSILAALFWMMLALRFTESILSRCPIASVIRSSAVASSESPFRAEAFLRTTWHDPATCCSPGPGL
jgi:hypothetical protein